MERRFIGPYASLSSIPLPLLVHAPSPPRPNLPLALGHSLTYPFDLNSTSNVIGMSHLSTSLRSESEKYRKAAKNINFQAMLRQYAPLAAVGFFVFLILLWRFW